MTNTNAATSPETIVEIPLEKIARSPFQPRQRFDDIKIAELADSITINGLIQPITIRPIGKKESGRYELVAGDRRFKAFHHLKRKNIPAIVRELSDEETRKIILVENLQREDLTPMEEARYLQDLTLFYGGNRSQVAKEVGKTVVYINERLDLIKLP